jgi:hypothetical protein
MPSVPKKKSQPYKGTERRRVTRRGGSDRRDGVRWEPTMKNRRKGMGRRKPDFSWN